MGLVVFHVISVLGAVLAGILVPLYWLGYFVEPGSIHSIEIIFSFIALSNIFTYFKAKKKCWKNPLHWLAPGLFLELLCFLPTSAWFIALSHQSEANLLLFNLILLRHLIKVPKILDYFSEIKPLTYRIIPLVLLLPLLLHIITCGWLALGGGNGGTEGSQFDLYVRAMYWAFATLTTVGYGDITAQNNWQMLYSCFVGLAGVGFYGYMISNIASLLARQDAARERHMTQLENMVHYLDYHQIPKDLRKQVRDYYRYLWANKKTLDQLEDIELLPIPLQSQLFYHINRKSLDRIPFLKSASEEIFKDLMASLETQIVIPGECIFKKGEEGEYLFLIHSGKIDIKTDDGQIIATLGKGDFFGEQALLSSEMRNATAVARGYSDLFKLSKRSFHDVLVKYPDFRDYIESLNIERQISAD